MIRRLYIPVMPQDYYHRLYGLSGHDDKDSHDAITRIMFEIKILCFNWYYFR